MIKIAEDKLKFILKGVRLVEIDGVEYILASDIASKLGYKSYHTFYRRIDNKYKLKIKYSEIPKLGVSMSEEEMRLYITGIMLVEKEEAINLMIDSDTEIMNDIKKEFVKEAIYRLIDDSVVNLNSKSDNKPNPYINDNNYKDKRFTIEEKLDYFAYNICENFQDIFEDSVEYVVSSIYKDSLDNYFKSDDEICEYYFELIEHLYFNIEWTKDYTVLERMSGDIIDLVNKRLAEKGVCR